MDRSAVHDTFSFNRHYGAAPGRVYQAFSDSTAKGQWFTGPAESKQEDVSFDFREGGKETVTTILEDGMRITFAATYTDIVPPERIVYTYEMAMNGQRISVSVVTIELHAGAGGGTDLILTEQGVYLDGLDSPQQRRQGTEVLLAELAGHLGEEG
jgi:uncharacterized protein YndB with AHSA1/START domain